MTFKGSSITASDVSKFCLMPPSQTTKKNKYPVESCRSFMREVSSAGFGELVNDNDTAKRSLIFRKRSYDEPAGKFKENQSGC